MTHKQSDETKKYAPFSNHPQLGNKSKLNMHGHVCFPVTNSFTFAKDFKLYLRIAGPTLNRGPILKLEINAI